jgi:hypothetical protein
VTQTTDSTAKEISYIIYDKVTGLPVGRHRHFDATDNKFVEADETEALLIFTNDESTLQKLTDGDAANLAILKSDAPPSKLQRAMRVSKNRLVQQPTLVIFSDRHEIEGDGKDSVTLTIMLQNENGQVLNSATDEMLVTTSRGKLSARAGRISLKNGRAALTLTSVPETVSMVRVRARLINGAAQPAETRLAFV